MLILGTQPQKDYNAAHKATRSTVECLFGRWKKRFPVLVKEIQCKLDTAVIVIVATAVLHNIATDLDEYIFTQYPGK